ncbi:MAG: flagellar basal-body rod protein FlgG [Pseudomonadota bacterium]
MNDALYIAATGMQAQQQSIDNIANNMVNVSTTGFKKSRINFQELMHVGTNGNPSGAAGNVSLLGIGISVDSIAKDFSSGILTQTDSQLDIAINGSGFLEVTLADGSHGYSRGGTLEVTKDSYLATSGGHVLKPAIHIAANASAVIIGANGKVSVQTQTGPHVTTTDVGQLELVDFSNPSGLKVAGKGVYTPTETSGDAIYGKPGEQGMGTFTQGALENSNVSLVEEMVALMVAQRAYELSSKMAQASDEMMTMTNNLRR